MKNLVRSFLTGAVCLVSMSALARNDRSVQSLDEALNCLEDDHGFMMKGDVFSEELIETFIDYKRKNEADAVRLRPHPYEFALYYDV